MRALRGALRCEAPNDKVNDFSGALDLEADTPAAGHRAGGHAGGGQAGGEHGGASGGANGAAAAAPPGTIVVTEGNLLLRGCQLRNAEYVLGLVVSTGTDAKIEFVSGAKRKTKQGSINKVVNADIAGITCCLVALCLATAVAAQVWKGGHAAALASYLGGPGPGGRNITVGTGRRGGPVDGAGGARTTFAQSFGRAFLLNFQLLPISLYVSISLVYTFQRFYMVNDLEMYHAPTDEPAQVRAVLRIYILLPCRRPKVREAHCVCGGG